MSLKYFIFAQISGHVCNFPAPKKFFFIVLLPAHVYMHPKVILNMLHMFPSHLECVEPDLFLIFHCDFQILLTFENRKSDSDG